jgi:DNA invertase Pin-like site-specific DNA recombinase
MMRTIDALRRDGVHFESLTEKFDSDTAHGRFALQMLGAMAEYFLVRRASNCRRSCRCPPHTALVSRIHAYYYYKTYNYNYGRYLKQRELANSLLRLQSTIR